MGNISPAGPHSYSPQVVLGSVFPNVTRRIWLTKSVAIEEFPDPLNRAALHDKVLGPKIDLQYCRNYFLWIAHYCHTINSTKAGSVLAVIMGFTQLKQIFDVADAHDRKIGLESFRKYNQLLQTIGETFSYDVVTAAGVFSTLSPNSDYVGNVRDTIRLLRAASSHEPYDSFSVSTYGQNKKKAWRIANGENPYDLIVARKTRNFFINLADPDNDRAVTIDGHMRNAWDGIRRNLVGSNVSAAVYEECASAVRQIAADVKMIPWQVQGIIWFCWKRIHRIKIEPQMDLWDAGYLAASQMMVPCL